MQRLVALLFEVWELIKQHWKRSIHVKAASSLISLGILIIGDQLLTFDLSIAIYNIVVGFLNKLLGTSFNTYSPVAGEVGSIVWFAFLLIVLGLGYLLVYEFLLSKKEANDKELINVGKAKTLRKFYHVMGWRYDNSVQDNIEMFKGLFEQVEQIENPLRIIVGKILDLKAKKSKPGNICNEITINLLEQSLSSVSRQEIANRVKALTDLDVLDHYKEEGVWKVRVVSPSSDDGWNWFLQFIVNSNILPSEIVLKNDFARLDS